MAWLKFKTDKREFSLNLPRTWYDCTFDQWLKLKYEWDGNDLLKLLSIMGSEPLEKISATESSNINISIFESMSFIYDQKFSFDDLKLPEVITINERNALIPTDLMKETFGQKVMLMQYINDPDYYIETTIEEEEVTRDYSKLLHIAAAVYLQPQIDGMPFDADKAEGYFDQFKQMPVTDIYPLGSFFLNRSKLLMKPGSIGLYHRTRTSIKNVLFWLKRRMSKGLKASRT